MSNIEKIKVVKDIVDLAEYDFNKNAAVHGAVSYNQEASFSMQILRNNQYLAGVAYNNQDSLKAAIINVANIGLSLNPVKKLAYLVPRDGKVCLDVSYIGLISLALNTGNISWVKADLVYEADEFIHTGLGREPVHKFNPFGERGKILGCYCVAKLKDGDYITEIMGIEEIYAIRNRSIAYKSYLKDKSKSCPWVTDEGEMIKKTVIRRAYKSWPMVNTQRFDSAIEATQDVHEIDLDAKLSVAPDNEYAELIEKCAAKIDFLGRSEEDVKTYLGRLFQRKLNGLNDLTVNELHKFNSILDSSIEMKLKEVENKQLNTGEHNEKHTTD